MTCVETRLVRRAYKLGKKRWSYNQVELLLTGPDGSLAPVKQTAHASDVEFPAAIQASCQFLMQHAAAAQCCQTRAAQ